MFRPAVLALVALTACSSPEKEASAVALAYASAGYDQQAASYDLSCSDERAVKSKEDFLAQVDSLKALMGARWDEAIAAAKKTTWSVKGTALNPEQTEGSVEIAASQPTTEGASKEDVSTVKVRLEGEAWCVVTGWAEQARLDGIATEGEALIEKAKAEIDSWALDEAEATIASAEAKLVELPEDYAGRSLLATSISVQREILNILKAGWVGGRWRVTEEVDPMTDIKNVVASLQSTAGMPNAIGADKPASLIIRCNRGKLDAYVSTPSMLDSDWRYDSVSGQHRFGSAPPEKLSGGVSTDRKAVFLRSPKTWLARFAEHEAETWTVELPLYGRMPASARFDLAATGKALEKLPEGCR